MSLLVLLASGAVFQTIGDVLIEIEENNKAWKCTFPFHPEIVRRLKLVPGAKFVPVEKGGPAWRIPPTIASVESIYEHFPSSQVNFSEEISSWARKEAETRSSLKALAAAVTADLDSLHELHPELHDFVSTRGYQLADIAFMATADHALNCNEPGTGKTVETIGAIYESGLEQGPVLVVAPFTALDATWGDALEQWGLGAPVVTSSGTGAKRKKAINDALDRAEAGEQIWVVMNPESFKLNSIGRSTFPKVLTTRWNVVVLDEFHKMGMGNTSTLFFKTAKKLKAEKRILLSGTPMGGTPIKLWSALHFLYPTEFPSKWQFAARWLSVYDNGFGQQFGDVLKHRRDEFTEMMGQYMVRRLKTDIMKWLPPKNQIVKWVRLEGKQKNQYDEWAANTEIEIEDELLSAVSILAVYTRLRQFANAVQEITHRDDGSPNIKPTAVSAKLPYLLEILEDLGIPAQEGDGQVVVFSQFTQFINVISEWLTKQGIAHGVITGQVKGADRAPLVRGFQAGEFRVMLMNTQAGGVSITLDRADTVVFMDETWNPDDQTQAEDRTHRGSKSSQVNIYRILARDTIEEDIFEGNLTKESINVRVLNARSPSGSH